MLKCMFSTAAAIRSIFISITKEKYRGQCYDFDVFANVLAKNNDLLSNQREIGTYIHLINFRHKTNGH
jgi:hypothetical protein